MANRTLLLRNATIVARMDDAGREIPDGGVFVRGHAIEAVGPSSARVLIGAWRGPAPSGIIGRTPRGRRESDRWKPHCIKTVLPSVSIPLHPGAEKCYRETERINRCDRSVTTWPRRAAIGSGFIGAPFMRRRPC